MESVSGFGDDSRYNGEVAVAGSSADCISFAYRPARKRSRPHDRSEANPAETVTLIRRGESGSTRRRFSTSPAAASVDTA